MKSAPVYRLACPRRPAAPTGPQRPAMGGLCRAALGDGARFRGPQEVLGSGFRVWGGPGFGGERLRRSQAGPQSALWQSGHRGRVTV